MRAQFSAAGAADTEALGARVARAQPAGGAFTVIYLCGELGSGKTTLVRGFLQGLGYTGVVRSPTYTLIELYPLAGQVFLHADLYRLQDPSELESTGIRDYAQAGYVWLIEWPERAQGHLPGADLVLALSFAAHAHRIDAEARTDAGEQWLRGLSGA
jgi:tRNA threonylcarbamoyladenosine biosynthesis protein TsaE